MTFSILPRAQGLPIGLTGKILSCTLLCAGCMTFRYCNAALKCVDVPILLYVHTVPTYGREACERKAMNQ